MQMLLLVWDFGVERYTFRFMILYSVFHGPAWRKLSPCFVKNMTYQFRISWGRKSVNNVLVYTLVRSNIREYCVGVLRAKKLVKNSTISFAIQNGFFGVNIVFKWQLMSCSNTQLFKCKTKPKAHYWRQDEMKWVSYKNLKSKLIP